MTPYTAHAETIAFAQVSLTKRVLNAAARTWSIWRNRREFGRLAVMNDIELADIGLTRSDLALVSELPLTEDPTARLGMLARRRAI